MKKKWAIPTADHIPVKIIAMKKINFIKRKATVTGRLHHHLRHSPAAFNLQMMRKGMPRKTPAISDILCRQAPLENLKIFVLPAFFTGAGSLPPRVASGFFPDSLAAFFTHPDARATAVNITKTNSIAAFVFTESLLPHYF